MSVTFRHPLDPVSIGEVERTTAFLRDVVLPEKGFALCAPVEQCVSSVRIITIDAAEPPKALLAAHVPGAPWDRRVMVVLFYVRRRADDVKRAFPENGAVECVVSLGNPGDTTAPSLVGWDELPNVQPSICADEFEEVERLVTTDKAFLERMALRGLKNPEMFMVEPWSDGFGGEKKPFRAVRALVWVRLAAPDESGYAHPVEGVVANVNLVTGEVKVDDYLSHPTPADVPQQSCNYGTRYQRSFRNDLKPIEIRQPQGVSFTVKGRLVEWQKWQLRVGWNLREGLVLYDIRYKDGPIVRPLFHRMSVCEMVVPYGSPSPIHNRKNAFDIGEYGLGMLANSLQLGCDCVGEIFYFDGMLHNSKGEPMVHPHVVCMHEEDVGTLWKHTDWRRQDLPGGIEVRRSRRLVVSFMCTVGNYEYGFFYNFYMDGTIKLEVKHSGIVNTSVDPTERYGTHLNNEKLTAQIHQHHYCLRVDPCIDGPNNRVVEINSRPEDDDKNPYGNAFIAETTVLETEKQARRHVSTEQARIWVVESTTRRNRAGKPTGWALLPGGNCMALCKPNSWIMNRASFLRYHFWCTPFDERQLYAGGQYPNQSTGEVPNGLLAYTEGDRNVVDRDIVLWYTFGMHHVVRLEDYPVMPLAMLSVTLKPHGFFDENPALDVPPSAKNGCSHKAEACDSRL
mmetsp:Transcript_31352/g.87934  ORF Transcript_31352/g.87934 Transcript_31352/m.87934 type:complete len:679 (-) Transcript_31352:87-2123(-)